MTHLLDVNALVALGFMQHEFHSRVASWASANSSLLLGTCSITELGFLRVLTQTPLYGFTIPQARALLLRLKRTEVPRFVFVSDDHDVSHLPAWVKTARQITDGHLLRLARSNRAVLATLDRGIPGAFLIP
jgi:predicted nucleic acid-binding protein